VIFMDPGAHRENPMEQVRICGLSQTRTISLSLKSTINDYHKINGSETILVKFCPNCGNQLQFENAEICPSCGKNISVAPVSATAQRNTSMNRQEIFGRAIPFFATKTYAVQTQTDYVIAFESQNRVFSTGTEKGGFTGFSGFGRGIRKGNGARFGRIFPLVIYPRIPDIPGD